MDRGSYSEKLKDPRWQKMRLKIFERDGWKCRECGHADRTLHVHHLYYDAGKDPWEYDLSALLTLCEECHDFETTNRRQAEDVLLERARRDGLMIGDLQSLPELFFLIKLTADPDKSNWAILGISHFQDHPDYLEKVLREAAGLRREEHGTSSQR